MGRVWADHLTAGFDALGVEVYIYIIRVAVYRIKADDDEGNFAGLDFLCEEPFPQY